jgi:enoyl-CoA hydratase/carnithine racemase
MPGAGGTQRLTRALGKALALELLLTGKRFSAAQALGWGLVNAVVPAGRALEEALSLAERVALQPPLAARQIKACVKAALELGLSGGLKEERRRFYALFDTADQKEGMAAFIEKRPAKFVGK